MERGRQGSFRCEYKSKRKLAAVTISPMHNFRFLVTVLVLLMGRQSVGKRMSEENHPRPTVTSSLKYSGLKSRQQQTVTISQRAIVETVQPEALSRDKRFLGALGSGAVRAATFRNVTAANGVMSGAVQGGSYTRDTIVLLITLTIIFFTLVATYFLWRRHRSNVSASHSVYMYSRLSQNDVEVDNISFQGDLTHKPLINNTVPVCAEEDSCDDDQVRPATLCLEYDSLVTISSEDSNEQKKRSATNRSRSSSVSADDTPVNLLIDDLSDEDLLQ